jgi:hypothetical protein
MAAGVACIAFASGTLVLPAQTLYERQLLVDHVLKYVHRSQQVRVRVDYSTWVVGHPEDPVVCQGCTRPVERAVCRHLGSRTTAYCVTCALTRPRLTMALLAHLPTTAILCDVQAHSTFGGESIAWTRWPQATPAEIMDDMRLQRRFAPVLTWACTEIRLPPDDTWQTQRSSSRRAKTLPHGVRCRGAGAVSCPVGTRPVRNRDSNDLRRREHGGTAERHIALPGRGAVEHQRGRARA